jgi:uncharacterized membrane protein
MSSQAAAPKSAATLVTGSQHALYGAAISAIGLAHIVRPELFESLNRRMFTRNIRRHVYINGAIETQGPSTQPVIARIRRPSAIQLLASWWMPHCIVSK